MNVTFSTAKHFNEEKTWFTLLLIKSLLDISFESSTSLDNLLASVAERLTGYKDVVDKGIEHDPLAASYQL